MLRESIAIVVDRSYGTRLQGLLPNHYLWVIYSEANQRVVEAMWRAMTSEDLNGMLVTIGSSQHELPDLRAEFVSMLDSAIEHFLQVRGIEVFGYNAADEGFWDRALLERKFNRNLADQNALRYSQ